MKARAFVGVLMLAILTEHALAQADKPAAVVNGQTITFAEIDNVLKHRPPSPTPLTPAQTNELRAMILDMEIDNLIMQQYMRQHMPPVPDELVNRRIDELKTALGKDGKTLAYYLQNTGLTQEQLRTNIINRLQREAYIRTHLTEDAVRAYYTANRDYFDHVAVRVSHIVLRVPANASPTERGITREKLQQLRQQIVSGKISFADAARKISQCPSAPDGGDLGYIHRKLQVDESFARAAFALKVGEISDVVETDYGMHLITVTDRKQSGPASTFEKVQQDARAMAADEMLSNLSVALRQQAHVQIYLDNSSRSH
jgi:parvulin-like peptidyl-prolyl isomerase